VVKKLIANVSTIFLLPVFEKSVIFDYFPAITHSISAREGGNTVRWKAMARKRTVDDSMMYWFFGNTLWRDYGAWNLAFLIRRHQKWARRLDLLSSSKLQ